jgi:hypothetical protein
MKFFAGAIPIEVVQIMANNLAVDQNKIGSPIYGRAVYGRDNDFRESVSVMGRF